jgi:two-component system, sensor histidine kinase
VTPALRHSRRAIKRAGRETTFLVILSAVLMAVLVATFGYLYARQNALQDGIREDALWAVYQLDREARTLAHAMSAAQSQWPVEASRIAELSLRYDILYSRLSILSNAKYETSLASSAGFVGSRASIRDKVLGLEPFFNGMASSAPLDRDEFSIATSDLLALVPVTERMLTDTNTAVSALRADARAEVMRIQQATALLVLIIAVSIALLILNLMRQLKLTRRTTGQLEAAANEISKAYTAAEAGNRAKSEFMAVMGHEIRTPLNAILGMTELLAHADLPEEDRRGVKVIASSGQALLEIINEILDFAKIEHGDLVLDTIAFEPQKLAEDAMEVVAGRAADQGDRLELEVSGSLQGRAVLSDPTRIRRVLLNLLSNAVKFTQNGEVRLHVSQPAPNRIRFEVADTGIGISAEALPRLFNPFTQEDGTISRRFGGTGLGLAICKKTIEAMGGDIGVQSTAGSGSVFWFELPIETVQAPLTDTAPIDPKAALPVRNILVVEDNAVNRDVALRFLQKLGQRVTMAIDGLEGVSHAKAGGFDLILMDMQMPVMDGLAATREIRSHELQTGKRARIVAMTANASDTDRALCMEAGMDAFVAKPITLARLADVIRGPEASASSPISSDARSDHPVIDQERRLELTEAFGADGLKELDDSFFSDAAGILRAFHAALSAGDAASADRALHSLKGASANLGFVDFSTFTEKARSDTLRADLGTEIEKRLATIREAGEQAHAA